MWSQTNILLQPAEINGNIYIEFEIEKLTVVGNIVAPAAMYNVTALDEGAYGIHGESENVSHGVLAPELNVAWQRGRRRLCQLLRQELSQNLDGENHVRWFIRLNRSARPEDWGSEDHSCFLLDRSA